MMKTKCKFLLSGLLVSAIILTNISVYAYAEIHNLGVQLFSQFVNMTEEEIYESKIGEPAESLLVEIKELEKELTDNDDKIALLPYAMALIEKKNEFSPEKIINLLEDDDTEALLESALIKMYIEKESDMNKLLPLLNSSKLNQESKEYIVALSNLSNDDLKDIYYKNDNSVAIIAMKKLMVSDPVSAFNVATEVLMSDTQSITNEKLLSSCLGIGEYYSKYDGDNEKKDLIIKKVKELFSTCENEVVKDNIIYSMARMQDFEVLKYVIDSEDIDKELKISTIERNIDLLVEKASTITSQEELSYIEKAMRIHPVLEIGEALKTSTTKGIQSESDELSSTIKYIENFGIKGVFKYE